MNFDDYMHIKQEARSGATVRWSIQNVKHYNVISKIIYRSNPTVAGLQGRDPQPSHVDATHWVMSSLLQSNAKKQNNK